MGRKAEGAGHRVRFQLDSADVSSIRFGISPGHELCHAVRAMLNPQASPLQWGWFRGVRDRVPAAPFELLADVIGADSYMPDFFSATPSGEMTPDEEVERLRAVPGERVAYDLAKMVRRSDGARRRRLQAMVADPADARERIADAWSQLWDAVLAPHWTQLGRVARADIAVRARRIADVGLGAMIDSLHGTVRWSDGAVDVRTRFHSEDVDCAGRGLVLVPSVMMAGRGCAVITEPPAVPTLFYPAQGVTTDWQAPSEDAGAALAALLGEGRARLLLALHRPQSTTTAAADAGLAISTASHHLAILRASGLVDSTRQGPSVMHARTPLGEALAVNGRA
jgi:DNA-binding transcriptional ArsR family regulator